MKFLNKVFSQKNIPHIFICFAICLFVLFLIMFNIKIYKEPLNPDDGMKFVKATVTKIITDNKSESGKADGSQVVEIAIKSGEHSGESCIAQNMAGHLYGAQCKVGTKVVVQLSEYNGELSANVYNYDRGTVLYCLIGVFLVILCLIGGKKGVMSGVSLIFTFICIIFLYVPLIYIGKSPFWSAVITVIIVTIVDIYFISGISKKSACAITGTIVGVVIAGIIATVFGHLSNISGYNVSEIESLLFIQQHSKINIGGMMFSGILISSLGAVMDVSMSIASTINELHINNPEMKTKQLFVSGLHVGKDMMGTMSNTLILAFAGSSINTIMIIYAYSMPYLQVINMYSIGIQILQGISGTLGVILTVPIVSLIASLWMPNKNLQHKELTQ